MSHKANQIDCSLTCQ